MMTQSKTGAKLPTFLVIGASKCGTSSLAAYLAAHPTVFMATPKELRFFSHQWDRGVDWYRSKFSQASPDHPRGEASPQYTQDPIFPLVPQRIASVVPDAKLVYLVRDPVEQMRSYHRHMVHRGTETNREFGKAIRNQPRYLAATSYGRQLSLYLNYFSAESILVVPTRQLLDDRATAMRKVLEHIGGDTEVLPPNLDEMRNTRDEKTVLPSYFDSPRAVWRKYRGLTGRLPRSWRRSIRGLLGTPLPSEASEVDPGTADWIRDNLSADRELLDKLTGNSLSHWTSDWFAAPSAGKRR
jgi:hypothetical protein